MNGCELVLERLRPLLAPARPEEVVRRIDAGRGERLHVQLDRDGRRSWVEVGPAGCRHLTLADERRLPLLAGAGAADLPAVDPTPLAWYPGRRVVLAASDPEHPAVVKGYREGRSADAHARHALAIRACAGGPLLVPSVVRHVEHAAALVTERVDGRPLGGAELEAGNLFRIGVGLRWFQRDLAPPLAGLDLLPHHDAGAELGTLDTLAGRVARTTERLPEGWERVRAELGRWAVELPAVAPVLAHRDLHDRQVLVVGSHLWWIDFDLLSLADPLLDAANLSAHLLLRGLQRHGGLDESTAEPLGVALLDGLDRYDEPGFWQRLRFYQATTLLRLAAVYAMRPPWLHRTPDLLHYAERCLRERAQA